MSAAIVRLRDACAVVDRLLADVEAAMLSADRATIERARADVATARRVLRASIDHSRPGCVRPVRPAMEPPP